MRKYNMVRQNSVISADTRMCIFIFVDREYEHLSWLFSMPVHPTFLLLLYLCFTLAIFESAIFQM